MKYLSPKNLREIIHDTSGVIFIEFALVLSFLLVPLIVGLLEFGLLMYEYSQIIKLVESATLYVTKNSANIYAQNPVNTANIVTAVGKSPWGETISVAAGCACPSSIIGGTTTLVQFQTPPSPKCSQSLVCSSNTQPMTPYVSIKAVHPHSYIFASSLFPSLSASFENIVRIN